jgi:hypothetical protein
LSDVFAILDELAHNPYKVVLQRIPQAYLEMVVEGIVTTIPELKYAYPEQFYSWDNYQYTQRDVEKAVDAFTRLLDAIESRLPPMISNQKK